MTVKHGPAKANMVIIVLYIGKSAVGTKKSQPYWGTAQVVCLKWECMDTSTITKRDYPIDFMNVNASGRRNRRCITVLIVKVKKTKERTMMDAMVNVGQDYLFGAFPSVRAALPTHLCYAKRAAGANTGMR
jgi:hypothetical protein